MDDTDYFTLLTCFFFLPQTKLFCKVFRKQSSISFFVCVWGEWKCCNDTGKGSDFHSIRLQHYPQSLLCCQRGSRSLRGPYRRQESKHVDNLFITYINSTTSNLLISNLNSFSRSLSPFKEMTHFHLHYLMTMECFRFWFFFKDR